MAVQFSDAIDVGHEIVAIRKRTNEFHLEVLLWMADVNAIFLCKSFEQHDPLPQHAFPIVPVAEFEIDSR